MILLVDVDSKIPNLVLTKISSFHKEHGERVKLVRLGLSGYASSQKAKTVDATGAGHVYVSNIFTHNKKRTKKFRPCKGTITPLFFEPKY